MVAVLTIGIIGFLLDRHHVCAADAPSPSRRTAREARDGNSRTQRTVAKPTARAPARTDVLHGHQPEGRGRRVRRHRRLFRLRQDDADLAAGRADQARRGRRVCSATSEIDRPGPGARRRVPVLFADAVAVGRGNVALAVDSVLPRQAEGRAQGHHRHAISTWSASSHAARPQAGRTVRRHAPARRGGPRARHAARKCCCSTSRCRRSTR